jgi:hypothetical protein
MTGDTLYLTAAGWITEQQWTPMTSKFGEHERPSGTLAVWKRNRAGAWEQAWVNPHISRALIEAALREFPGEGIAF